MNRKQIEHRANATKLSEGLDPADAALIAQLRLDLRVVLGELDTSNKRLEMYLSRNESLASCLSQEAESRGKAELALEQERARYTRLALRVADGLSD